MKWFILLLLFEVSNGAYTQQNERQQLRESFLQSCQRKSALDSFMGKLEKIIQKSPAEECYYGICHALKAQYISGTWAKIKLVTESRSLLNAAIAKDPNDPELRFMRLTFEHFVPSFLGMSRDIPTDLNVILQHPDFVSDNPPLKKKALEFLIATHHCNAEQCKVLQSQLATLNSKQIAGLTVSSNQ